MHWVWFDSIQVAGDMFLFLPLCKKEYIWHPAATSFPAPSCLSVKAPGNKAGKYILELWGSCTDKPGCGRAEVQVWQWQWQKPLHFKQWRKKNVPSGAGLLSCLCGAEGREEGWSQAVKLWLLFWETEWECQTAEEAVTEDWNCSEVWDWPTCSWGLITLLWTHLGWYLLKWSRCKRKSVVKNLLCYVFSKMWGDLLCRRTGTGAPLLLSYGDVMWNVLLPHHTLSLIFCSGTVAGC